MNENSNVVRLRHPDEIDDPLTNILRSGARQLLAQAIELEAEAFLAEMKGFKLADGPDRVVRHGHGPERMIQTGIGAVDVARVKIRGSRGGRRVAGLSPSSAMSCWLVGPSLLHNAHLSMSLKFKRFLQRIAGRRTSQTAGCRRALHVVSVQVGGVDDPGRSLTELIRRELTIFDQTAHGRRTNG